MQKEEEDEEEVKEEEEEVQDVCHGKLTVSRYSDVKKFSKSIFTVISFVHLCRCNLVELQPLLQQRPHRQLQQVTLLTQCQLMMMMMMTSEHVFV